MTSIIDALLDWMMIHFKGLLTLGGVLLICALVWALDTDWLGTVGFMVVLMVVLWLKKWWQMNHD